MAASRPRASPRTAGTPGRPYVICHMVPSVDGRIVTDRWPPTPGLVAEYELTAAAFGADGWIIGRS